MSVRASLLLASTLLLDVGCGGALTAKGEPLAIRYFDPEVRPGGVTLSAAHSGSPCELMLGRVGASSNLGDLIAFRDSPFEVGYYDARRWTQTPDNYLRRRLVRALFEERGCQRIMSGNAPTLDVELLVFELARPTQSARVAVHYVLYDDRSVLTEGTLEISKPARTGGETQGDAFDGFVGAISDALNDVTAQLATRVGDLAVVPAAKPAR